MADGPFLDLSHPKMIRAIAEHGRVSDAAEALGVTSSALSHRIKEAERRLDRGVEHVVRIAVEAYRSYHWLAGFTTYLQTHLPGGEFQIMASVTRDPVRALTNRHADIVVTSGDAIPTGTHRIAQFRDELMFIFPPHHALAGQAYVEGTDIEGEDFITNTLTPEPAREFARRFRPSGRYPRWTSMVEMPEAIVELVAAGQGSNVLAGWAVRPAIKAGPILEFGQTLTQWSSDNGGFG